MLPAHLSRSSAEWEQLRLPAHHWLLALPPPVLAGCHEAARAAHLHVCKASCQFCEFMQASKGCGAAKQQATAAPLPHCAPADCSRCNMVWHNSDASD